MDIILYRKQTIDQHKLYQETGVNLDTSGVKTGVRSGALVSKQVMLN